MYHYNLKQKNKQNENTMSSIARIITMAAAMCMANAIQIQQESTLRDDTNSHPQESTLRFDDHYQKC